MERKTQALSGKFYSKFPAILWKIMLAWKQIKGSSCHKFIMPVTLSVDASKIQKTPLTLFNNNTFHCSKKSISFSLIFQILRAGFIDFLSFLAIYQEAPKTRLDGLPRHPVAIGYYNRP